MKKVAKWVLIISIAILLFVVIGCGGDIPAEEPEEESKTYDGVFRFAGEGVTAEAESEHEDYTDIIITENMTDYEGNTFTPGVYEFQFIEFPDEQDKGSWYIYLNEDIKISGHPNASDAGKEYELKEGDTVSVEYWSIATFYKVAK